MCLLAGGAEGGSGNVLDSLHTDTICEAIEEASHKYHHETEQIVDKYLEESKKGESEKSRIKTVVGALRPKQKWRGKDEGRGAHEDEKHDHPEKHQDERERKKSRE